MRLASWRAASRANDPLRVLKEQQPFPDQINGLAASRANDPLRVLKEQQFYGATVRLPELQEQTTR